MTTAVTTTHFRQADSYDDDVYDDDIYDDDVYDVYDDDVYDDKLVTTTVVSYRKLAKFRLVIVVVPTLSS